MLRPDPEPASTGGWHGLPEGEPMGIEDIRDALIIRERSTFLLTDPDGNVPAGNRQGFGVYHADTRHLSAYTLTLNGTPPVMLLSTAERGFAMEQVMTNPTLSQETGELVPRGTVEIRRHRVIADVLVETLTLTNFNRFPVTLNLLYEFGADFADIFDVRGYKRERMGDLEAPVVTHDSIAYAYRGIDERRRGTVVQFDRAPNYIDASTALFFVTLPHREPLVQTFRVSSTEPDAQRTSAIRGAETIAEDYRAWSAGCTEITTDNNFLNRVLARSIDDIRMLQSSTRDGQQFFSAGTPWYDAFFGRDSCILSLQTLAYRTDIARSSLQLMAERQGVRVDPTHDEEPGKILHELRFDELSVAGELPYGPYYGTIDATPLFLWLAAEYFAWTGDADFMRELLPAIKRAIAWMRTHADDNGDGFLSYEKHSAKGLVNQGWKDSWDAIVHEDGSLARAPIALAEVQGYAYAALTRLAPVLARIGEQELSASLIDEAAALKDRFNSAFWMKDEKFYAMAVDGEGRAVRSLASNIGHCLWSGIIDPKRAKSLVRQLMSDELFSGWGIRTLTERNPRYNPIGYHLGTVWPHDNAIAAFGLKMYGFPDELNRLATAMFDAATSFEYLRLPELFGGERRTFHGPPVPYPVACRPQAWAAGAMPLMMQAMLGIRGNAPERRIHVVAPHLPRWLDWVSVRNLRVGDGTISLHYRRSGDHTRVEVQEVTGGVDVLFSHAWPL